MTWPLSSSMLELKEVPLDLGQEPGHGLLPVWHHHDHLVAILGDEVPQRHVPLEVGLPGLLGLIVVHPGLGWQGSGVVLAKAVPEASAQKSVKRASKSWDLCSSPLTLLGKASRMASQAFVVKMGKPHLS